MLSPYGAFLWDAWLALNSCRSQSWSGTAQIPWTAIQMYAYHYGLSESTFDDLVAACKALDAKLAELIESKAKGSA